MTQYGVMTDEEWRPTHKTDRLTVWSGAFMSSFEAEAISLPRGDGYMLYTYGGDKVRVECPVPRDDANFQAVDDAINAALNKHFEKKNRHPK
jgi:hypothetical protein